MLYCQAVGCLPSALTIPQVDVQRKLLEPLQRKQLDQLLVTGIAPVHKNKLNSLRSPHSTTWTSATSRFLNMSPEEYRWGLQWILGLPLRNAPYTCPACGSQGDILGIHAVTCARSGEKVRAHNRLRNVIGQMATHVGVKVTYERSLPHHCDLRPADVLFDSWQPLPLAVDFAIVTPNELILQLP